MSNYAKLLSVLGVLFSVVVGIIAVNLLEDNKLLKSDMKDIIETNNKLQLDITTLRIELDKSKEYSNSLEKSLSDSRSKNQALKKEILSIKERIPSPVTTSRGNAVQRKTLHMESTAYTAYCKGCTGLTYWKAIDLRKNPSTKVIAVDPRKIPLGSKVHVEGYGYAIAADIGGDIKGNRIDVFIPERKNALSWGRKVVKVTILK